MAVADVVRWRTAPESLHQQHGKVVAYSRGDRPGTAQGDVTVLALTWADGYTRCLLAQQTAKGQVFLLDGDYRDCAAMPPAP